MNLIIIELYLSILVLPIILYGIIAVSNTVKNDLIYLGVKSQKIKVINNPINIPKFIKIISRWSLKNLS